MRKEKRIILRIDDDLYNFLKKESHSNRSTVSYEVRKLILEKYNIK
jgi:hypothetical protein